MSNYLSKIIITNDIKIAKYCDDCGVDIIMIDHEYIGKDDRQKGLDSVKNKHDLEDITGIREVVKNAKIMARINPFYDCTKEEIDKAINSGADYIMLPMFRSGEEIQKTMDIIDGRAKLIPLLETSQAYARIDEILDVDGVFMYHIGLNDLHLSFGLDFMFECISLGLVEHITAKMKEKGIRYGIGGTSRLNTGTLQSNLILSENARLGSEQVILSRSFYDYATTLEEMKNKIDLKSEIDKLNTFYTKIQQFSSEEYEENKMKLFEGVNKIVKEKRNV